MFKKLKILIISMIFASSCLAVFPQKANAQSLTVIADNSNYSIKACKKSKNSIYGPLWEVTIVVARKNPPGTKFRVLGSLTSVLRNGNSVYDSPYYNSWYNNEVQAYTVLSSQFYNDTVRVTVHLDEMSNPVLVLHDYLKAIPAITLCDPSSQPPIW